MDELYSEQHLPVVSEEAHSEDDELKNASALGLFLHRWRQDGRKQVIRTEKREEDRKQELRMEKVR